MMNKLLDNHGREINYARLAVTDRCNLRCFYCMPEQGIDYVPREDLLDYEEMVRLVCLLKTLGITKLRITGGEPFLRKDMMQFLRMIRTQSEITDIHITTNGTLTYEHVPELKELGISSVNLSLDTLDPSRFFEITRRDVYRQVKATFDGLIEHEIRTKINMVVMEHKNIDDIVPMALLAKDHDVDVRYIEEMPFNGKGSHYKALAWNHSEILQHLRHAFPKIRKLKMRPGATAQQFEIPGFRGRLGIIAAFSRTFCGSCNRIRITPSGMLRTCLYDQGVFNIKNLMRQGATDEQIAATLRQALNHRAKDGFEAEQRRAGMPIQESMSTIGG
ncbi:MAG: GTP 3',8-cyclase MoaA [Saprospiraceae bacterium]|nr:GTP 3',8-cyclase MoaA [Saprospiraceae bacterium]